MVLRDKSRQGCFDLLLKKKKALIKPPIMCDPIHRATPTPDTPAHHEASPEEGGAHI